MRIRLSGRRLALAAVLLLGGAAAPLAYATISAPAAQPAAVSTGTDTPSLVAYAHVLADGTLDAGRSKNVLSSTRQVSPGNSFVYCLEVTFAPSNAVSSLERTTARPVEDGLFLAVSETTVDPDLATSWGCPTGTDAAVRLGGAGDGLPFYVALMGQEPPVTVALRSFSASRAPSGIRLRWRTANEAQMLGFNLYRTDRGKPVRLNRGLISSVRAPAGQTYSWLDRHPPATEATYRLEAVRLDGSRSWLGSARAS